ncbi:inositol monophosphatase family protein [Nonomuraea sp. bgisy101]|uniref:inositol monophosphatase family protein n=1 Tax=Nonomuraea sp. bgisy101 TaxID=3413784 RepID=UPI003D7488B3
MWINKVTEILLDAAEIAILPRFRALADGEVTEKSPDEVVTVADREAEELISRGLRGVVDAPVVGEEATAGDPRLLMALREAPAAWLVDPLDGTSAGNRVSIMQDGPANKCVYNEKFFWIGRHSDRLLDRFWIFTHL